MKTILLVDDSPCVRRTIRGMVESMGFTVKEAGNGLEAMRHCEEDAGIDVILLDVEMPEMDGLSFLRMLRGRTDLAQPRVVMCTTHDSLTTIREALVSGADEFIMKPFDQHILGGKLSGVGITA